MYVKKFNFKYDTETRRTIASIKIKSGFRLNYKRMSSSRDFLQPEKIQSNFAPSNILNSTKIPVIEYEVLLPSYDT